LLILFAGSRLFPRWPVMLIATLASAAAVALFGLQDLGVAVVGAAAASPQAPALPLLPLDDWIALLLPAACIAMVGYSDNMLTARSFAARKGQDVDGNTELVALGAGNLLAGLIRGFPVSSSGSRTSIGDAQGSRTQLHSLVAVVAVVVVVLILAFGQAVLAAFPTAALGAVVIYAALRLIDVGEFRRIARFRWSELGIALVITIAVVVLGVLYGVIAAVAVSVVELLHRLARSHDAVLGLVPGVAGMHDLEDYPDARAIPGLVVYRYDAPLCFANAEDFRRSALAAAADAGPGPSRWIVLNAEANVELDLTAAEALHALITELRRRGMVFATARVKQDLRDVLVRAGLVELIGAERMYMTLPTAVAAYRERVAAES
jgi:sulfate permease, SulP family